MTRIFNVIVANSIIFTVAAPATAASYSASSVDLAAVFAAAGAGDTITLRGDFGETSFVNRSFATPLTIVASAATFNGLTRVTNVSGLKFVGGTWGSPTATWQAPMSVSVLGGANISFLNPTVIGNGLGTVRGIGLRDTVGVVVNGGNFTGLRQAIGVNGIRDGFLTNNTITASTSDGFNIVNSHYVTASGNSCSGTVPSPGAHPDCIQLWSTVGLPMQSHIRIIDNIATGHTQGFTSFDPTYRSGRWIEMSGNIVNTSLPQGIACYGCYDSLIFGNVLTTLPGSRFRTYLRTPSGVRNRVYDNSIAPYTTLKAPINARSFGVAAVGGVPEPLVWAQLIAGFGLIGTTLRHRRTRVTA